MQVICLIGQKRVGKDTVADIIQERDPEFQRFALADPIKDIARIMFSFKSEKAVRNMNMLVTIVYCKREAWINTIISTLQRTSMQPVW